MSEEVAADTSDGTDELEKLKKLAAERDQYLDLAARTRLSAALTAVSEQYMDNDEPNSLGAQIPAYAVLDVKLAREFGWGRIAAAVNNLLDEQYYTYAVRSQFTADRYAVYPLPGRSFSLSAELMLD